MSRPGYPISFPGRPWCGLCKKEIWETAEAAIGAMQNVETKTRRAYRCPAGAGFHQTGSGNRRRKQKGRKAR